MRTSRFARLGLALSALGVLGACTTLPWPRPDDLVLYDGRPHAGLHVVVSDFGPEQELTGASVVVTQKEPGKEVGVRVSGKQGAGDALTMHWKDVWYAGMRLVADKPLDLRPYLPDGTLEFDVNALDLAKSGLTFAMGCGPDCGRKLTYAVPSRGLQGLGWQHLSFSLQCFARDGHDFSTITKPFVVESGGSGQVALANVRIVRSGKPNATCPDYRTESVTPVPLAEAWALDWWMPRHEQKLKEVREMKAAGRNPQIVFIGDSITQGWEGAGRSVWDEYYKKYDAVDLGFGGDRTDNVLWRLQHGEADGLAPKVAVLMIGTNNTGHRQEDPKTTAAGIKRVVEELRQRLPSTKVLVLAIFPREEQPGGRLRGINNQVNGLIAGLHDGRDVFFLDIDTALLNPNGTLSKDVMPDLLHPNERGYRLWAQSMQPTLAKLLSLP